MILLFFRFYKFTARIWRTAWNFDSIPEEKKLSRKDSSEKVEDFWAKGRGFSYVVVQETGFYLWMEKPQKKALA
jgi:hypothetical protein